MSNQHSSPQHPSFIVDNLWDDTAASKCKNELELLVYRSNLLGIDRRVCNWKGGNTSTKSTETSVTGQSQRVLYVKGSGTDLADIDAKGFCGLRLDDVVPLIERDHMTDEEMVEYLLQCMIHPNMPRQSIETLLHAFIPFDYVDHTHPDAIIAIATTESGEQITKDVFGDKVAWVPYIRPGFDLAKQIGLIVRENPDLQGIVMGKHGLVTWGDDAKQCYNQTIAIINQAARYIDEKVRDRPMFGGAVFSPISNEERRQRQLDILPYIRGLVSQNRHMIVHLDDSSPVLDFVAGKDAKQLALTGAACPDHLVHTKYEPLFVDYNPETDTLDTLKQKLQEGIETYVEDYKQYVETCGTGEFEMNDPYPRVILIPGLGLFATGTTQSGAANTAGLFLRAIEVMRGASSLGTYVSMTPQEAYDVEYWPLELYKLTLAPPEKDLSRKVALITGGAGGIGRTTAFKLVEQGAHAVVTDIDADGASKVADEINERFGEGRAIAAAMDVTDPSQVKKAFEEAVLAYGGVDILVSNAGIAMAKPIEETELADWNKLFDILSTGYFLVSKEATRILKSQDVGGSIIFVTSKNAMVASSGAAAYNAAKAASLHLARSLAEELGKHGVRVNTVAPDAVLEGSTIWTGKWREERAAGYGIHPDQLEEHYRNRTTLRVNVYPDDIAEAIFFFASERASKTTGCTITVDGGVQAAYMR